MCADHLDELRVGNLMKDQLEAVKKKARLLKSAFPANLTLAQAQEATAKLLGFKDWHWLTQAAESGKPLLPALLPPTSAELPASIFKLVQMLHDEFQVPPGLARHFYFGWGVFTKPRTSPSPYQYFFWERVLRGDAPKEEGNDDEFIFDDDDAGPEEIIPGVIEAAGGAKHRYWFLSPERLNRIPWALRGRREAFLSFEGSAAVVLTFPDEFSLESQREAREFLRGESSYAWVFGKDDSADEGSGHQISVAKVRAQAAADPDAWFPLSYRWQALPYSPNLRGQPKIVVPAMQGRHLVGLIEAKGRFRLSDVKWFIPTGLLLWGREDGTLDPLNVNAMRECPPHYGYPFKNEPFSRSEYSSSEEGGDPGLGFVPSDENL